MDVDKIQQRMLKYEYERACAINKAEQIHTRKVLNLLDGVLSELHEEANKIQPHVKITMEDIERSAKDLGITIPKQPEV